MGWIGPTRRVHETLRACVDKDDQGRYLVRVQDGGAFYFMGDASENGEACVTDDVQVKVNGEWLALVPMLSGGVNVLVL